MAGHSKWSNIQGKKGKADAARGRIFTKLAKEIAVAAKDGSNIDTNTKLANAVSKAKAANMPNDNIDRAIKKGAGELSGVAYHEIVYEGYGAAGVAFVVEALTDNKNRSAGNVRSSFTKCKGNLGASGCVAWMFQKKGQLVIEKTDSVDEDELMMVAIDAGAEDFSSEDDNVYEITTAPEDFLTVKASLEESGFEFLEAVVTMVADNHTAVDTETAELIQKLVERLENDDDVQNVYHNAEFPEGFED